MSTQALALGEVAEVFDVERRKRQLADKTACGYPGVVRRSGTPPALGVDFAGYGGDVLSRCTSSTGVVMTITQIDLDDDALTEAMRLSGARSKKDTVNLALREYAARHRRIAALDHYVVAAQGWDYKGWQNMRTASKTPTA
jgi:Arc/MetJ family transcription regulator